MYSVKRTKEFEKSFRRLKYGGLKPSTILKVEETITLLSQGAVLSVNYRDHALQGKMKGVRECHIQGDLLLVYKIEQDILVLALLDIGSHAYLFG